MSASTLPRPEVRATSRLKLIDCDIHPAPRDMAVLDRYLPERWRRHRREYGLRLRQPFTSFLFSGFSSANCPMTAKRSG